MNKNEAFEKAKEIANQEATKVLEKEQFDCSALEQVKNQLNKLIKDFEEFYGPKGRKIKVVVHVIKDDKKDTVAEKWEFNDFQIVSAIDIGTAIKEEDLELEW